MLLSIVSIIECWNLMKLLWIRTANPQFKIFSLYRLLFIVNFFLNFRDYLCVDLYSHLLLKTWFFRYLICGIYLGRFLWIIVFFIWLLWNWFLTNFFFLWFLYFYYIAFDHIIFCNWVEVCFLSLAQKLFQIKWFLYFIYLKSFSIFFQRD